jgi:hypothetical protein
MCCWYLSTSSLYLLRNDSYHIRSDILSDVIVFHFGTILFKCSCKARRSVKVNPVVRIASKDDGCIGSIAFGSIRNNNNIFVRLNLRAIFWGSINPFGLGTWISSSSDMSLMYTGMWRRSFCIATRFSGRTRSSHWRSFSICSAAHSLVSIMALLNFSISSAILPYSFCS